MPTTTREYMAVKKIKGDRDLVPIRLAQVQAVNYLEGKINANQLKTNIGNITALAGIAYSVFGKSNAVGIALGVISFLASNPSTSHRNGMIQGLKNGNWQVQVFEGNLIGKYQYKETFDVELAFLEAKDWATKNHLFTGVTSVGKIHAFYDKKGNRIPV
ncbi:hypothetical protein MKY34_04000 [Sporosarcina sp. FSL K6-1522]|uniref:hypothetical protein n=1 Tax=Sporosarcina sp. FSL K6-1522 TaxID=2921554 RepID=UPI00315AD9C2